MVQTLAILMKVGMISMSDEATFTPGVLKKSDVEKSFWRYSIFGNNAFNYETMMAPLMVFSLAPALRKIYKNDDDLEASLANHWKYYNTNPIPGGALTGAVLAMEEQEGTKALDGVQALKTSLMGPLAGLGDSVFGVMLGTIMGSITGSMNINGQLALPMAISIIWSFINLFFIKRPLYMSGYKSGLAIVKRYGNQMNKLTDAASVMGVMVVGSIVPSVVKITTSLKIGANAKNMTDVQTGILDAIMPGLLSVILVAVLYKLLDSKHFTPVRCILLVMVFSLVAGFFGFLSA